MGSINKTATSGLIIFFSIFGVERQNVGGEVLRKPALNLALRMPWSTRYSALLRSRFYSTCQLTFKIQTRVSRNQNAIVNKLTIDIAATFGHLARN
jgi:hypothetical protein